jgi:hypothetical protein
MEKRLVIECENILKMEKPQRSFSACKLERVAPNLIFLQRKDPRDEVV